MHGIEMTGRKFDSFYIIMRELLWRQLRVGRKNSSIKNPASDFEYFYGF